MDVTTRTQLIQQYKDGYRAVAEALDGITEAEMDAHPAPGRWSPREIVHHLADAEMTGSVRLRIMLTADRPQIFAYDQDDYARRLYYDRPIDASLDAFRAARASSAELLERMSEAEWQREGVHSEAGRYTMERWLEIYAAHAHGHAQQIRMARQSAKPR